MPARIALVYRNGQWEMPECSCSFHYWAGKPDVDHLVYKSDLRVVVGVVAPHQHLCPKHAKEAGDGIL